MGNEWAKISTPYNAYLQYSQQGILFILDTKTYPRGPVYKWGGKNNSRPSSERAECIYYQERYCLKLHEDLLSKREYCHREKNCHRQGFFLYLFISVAHTACSSPYFKWGSGDMFCFKQVDTFRNVKGYVKGFCCAFCIYTTFMLNGWFQKSLKIFFTDSWLNPGYSSSSVLLILFPKFFRYSLWIFLPY